MYIEGLGYSGGKAIIYDQQPKFVMIRRIALRVLFRVHLFAPMSNGMELINT
jgi:hypothetical protein